MEKLNLNQNKLNENYEELAAVNQELEAYVQQLTGKPLSEIFPSIEEELIKKYGQVVKTGEPFGYEKYLEETGKFYDVITLDLEEMNL